MPRSAIGREVLISEHSEGDRDALTIVGVHRDFRLGNLKDEAARSLRPTVFFCDGPGAFVQPENVLVRLARMDAGTVARLGQWLSAQFPSRPLEATPLSLYIVQQLTDERNMRDAMLICSLAALIITLIGLLGHTADEVARRRREIAIRKVSGASVADILRLIGRDISLLALPALALGSAASWLISREWLTRYPDRIAQPLWLFLALLVAAYLLILSCLALRSLKAARENPAEAMKGE